MKLQSKSHKGQLYLYTSARVVERPLVSAYVRVQGVDEHRDVGPLKREAAHHESLSHSLNVQPAFYPPPYIFVATSAVRLVPPAWQLAKGVNSLDLPAEFAPLLAWRHKRVSLQCCFQCAVLHGAPQHFYRQPSAAPSAWHTPLLVGSVQH